jgi:hypothetical protein
VRERERKKAMNQNSPEVGMVGGVVEEKMDDAIR